MDKPPKLIEQIISDRKKNQKRTTILGTLSVLFIFGMPAVFVLSEPELRWASYVLFGVIAILLGFIIRGQLTLNKKLADMLTSAGVSSYDELEEIIKNSQGFSDQYFITDKYIINFSSPMVSELSEVISVKTYNGGDDGNDYIVKFSLRNGKKDVLVFHDMAVRDKVFKIITDAAENAADQKIW